MRAQQAIGSRTQSRFAKAFRNDWQKWILLIPCLAYLVVFCYAPIFGIIIAFKSYNSAQGILGSPWVGFAKFEMFFSSYYFGTILKNTLVLSLYAMVVNTIFPITLAVLLNEVPSLKLKRVFQTISYAPYFISLVVLVGMFNMFLSNDGFVNTVLKWIGLGNADFLSDPNWFATTYVFTGLWQGCGWWSIIYLGALSNIPQEIHEAAAVDGASRLQRIFKINIPYIAPTIVTLFVLAMGQTMNVGFEKVFLMQNGGNREVSEIISTYTYTISFGKLKDMSFGTAVGLFNSVINSVLLIGANFFSKKITDKGLF